LALRGTALAQDVDTLRSGVVKIVANEEGKQKTGAGFIVQHAPGNTLIITTSHVIKGDKFPKVKFYALRNTWIDAEVLYNDERSEIALLKIRDRTEVPSNVKVFLLSSSREVQVNEELITIGFPLGGGPWSVVRVRLVSRQGIDLTLDGNIDEGNSGGPVLKQDKIVGLVTNADRFGRAIPVEIVTMILEGWGIMLDENRQGASASSGTIQTSQACTSQPEARLSFEPEMVCIPPGKFIMGSPADEPGRVSDEGPQHEVDIAYSFEIGRYEVTFAEYAAFAEATNRKLPSDRKWGRGRRPIIDVKLNDARAYVKWLSERTGKKYRLPTEAEWEYAARAGSQTAYWWGNELGRENAACEGCSKQTIMKTMPVGSFNPNYFGLYDTAGNVTEWVEDDWHANYRNAPADGSAWKGSNDAKCNRGVIRSGAWIGDSDKLRSASRICPSDIATGLAVVGFRVARDF
jgi:formylglycine-generating enzyme required for sulfatase activity